MGKLIACLTIKTVLLGGLIGWGIIGLAPDEAQYWTWSQQLDWGYYSKPPAIAWMIALTTSLFGDNPLGIRFGALIIGFALPLIVHRVAREAGLKQQTAFWAAIAMAVSPLGFYLSFAATTDGGAILCLMIAIWLLIKGLKSEPNYWLMGVAILGGALFKWIAFVFWPVVFISLLKYKILRKWTLIGGILLSLCAFLPSFYWNLSHDWATFRHVGSTLKGSAAGNFFDFFAGQIALLSPIFFIFFVWSYFYPKKDGPLFILALFSGLIAIYLGASFFKKMQVNWGAYLYPSAFILAAWVAEEKIGKKIWLPLGSSLSLAMVVIAIAIVPLQEAGLPLSYSYNPFRQSVGWEKIASALEVAGYQPANDFLFGDKYQTASLLSFYGPDQKRAYFFNLAGSRKNQFSYWPQMDLNERGKKGYFVVFENTREEKLPWYIEHYTEKLAPYFTAVRFCGTYPLFAIGEKSVKYALIFEGDRYLGNSPSNVTFY